MKFGDIFPLLLVLLILYYAAIIAMDLYKSKLEKEAEKEKNTEEDIDISDEAATFQPIRIRRDEPQKSKTGDADATPCDSKSREDKSDEEKTKDNSSKDNTETEQSNTSEPRKDKNEDESPAPSDAEESRGKPRNNPYDPSNWEIPEEIIQERHRKVLNPDTKSPEHKAAASEQTELTETVSPPVLHEPIMDGGLLIEDLYELASNAAENGNADLQNIVMKCESD